MIVSFVNRLALYIAGLGLFIYVITPGFSYLTGDGYEINEYGWAVVIPVGIYFLYDEIKRYRNSHPKHRIK